MANDPDKDPSKRDLFQEAMEEIEEDAFFFGPHPSAALNQVNETALALFSISKPRRTRHGSLRFTAQM